MSAAAGVTASGKGADLGLPPPDGRWVEVYARSERAAYADALVEQLRGLGYLARANNSRRFDAVEAKRDPGPLAVFHDGSDPLIPWHYSVRKGLLIAVIPECDDHGHLAFVTEPYLVPADGGLFQLVSAEGEPIGQPQPTEAAAWAEGHTEEEADGGER